MYDHRIVAVVQQAAKHAVAAAQQPVAPCAGKPVGAGREKVPLELHYLFKR
jgi:hypothetical protein